MSTILRNKIIAGPAIVEFRGQRFYSKGDITVTPASSTFEITTGQFGKIDERVNEAYHEVAFEPDGRFGSAIISALFYALGLSIGASVFGKYDQPLTIWGLDGYKRVYKCAAVTKLPDIRMKSTETLFGGVTMTCIVADGKSPEEANSLYTESYEPFPGHDNFNSSDIITQSYNIMWGAAPFDKVEPMDGVVISSDLQTYDINVDSRGLTDKRISGINVSAKFQPVGITPQQIAGKIKHQGVGAERGRSLSKDGADMKISKGNVHVVIYGAALKSAPETYGHQSQRVGECEWVSTLKFGNGSFGCKMYVGDVAVNTAGAVTPIPKIEKVGTDKFKFTVATADTKLYTCSASDGFPDPTNVAATVHTSTTPNWTKEITFATLQTTPVLVQCYRPGSYPSEIIEITKDFGA